MNLTIIGPRSIGKSTLCPYLAELIGYIYVSGDEETHKALEAFGGIDAIIKRGDIDIIYKNSLPITKKIFSEHKDKMVYDLAGGALVSKTSSRRKYAEPCMEVVKKNSFLIGIIPYEDDDEKSIQFLFDREKKREHFLNADKEKLFQDTRKNYLKKKPLFYENCDCVIARNDREYHEIAQEIVELLKKKKLLK